MARTDGPLIGDINRAKFDPGDFQLSNTPGGFFNWLSDYRTDDGTLIDTGVPGSSAWGELYGEEGFHDDISPNTPVVDFGEFGYDQYQVQDILDNPAFSVFYNSFFEPGTWNANPAEWWKDYGAYLTPYDNVQEIMTKRKSGLEKESLRREALDTIDKMGGFQGKRGFAGDSGMIEAQKSIMEDAIRKNEMQTLGVNQSLWNIKDNYMSNLYSEFANLSQVGAFEGMGD
tara:strand:- start:20093 stop:20779 length:687 start_codon:yes stop_codon:yes gene_type:complete